MGERDGGRRAVRAAVNNHYLHEGRTGYSILDGYWTDAGTLDSLDVAQFEKLAVESGNNDYGAYLRRVLAEHRAGGA